MRNKVICISRQFGSGGHEIGVMTAEKLGLHLYEKSILRIACEYGGLNVKTLEDADEKATNPLLFRTVHEGNYHVLRGAPTSEVLFALQSHTIRRIARQESCIFVGRCADFVLKNAEVDVLSVFVCAPLEDRITRKMQNEQLSRDKAQRLVRKMDRQREKYYESFTNRQWGDPQYYQLYLDTGRISLEDAASLITERYQRMK